jgi:arsenic resistance protein ArsH
VDELRWKDYRLTGDAASNDWVQNLDLAGAKEFVFHSANSKPAENPKILLLYGSLRPVSYSKKLCYEFARVLEYLGADCRIFDPRDLPMHDVETNGKHPKVLELQALSEWSEGQVWVCPEQHGAITGVFKTQIDWIPLSIGSVRPTQGRTLALAQVSGGSQSFNVVNTLRLLGRWMRMITIPNQSSVPKAWTEFAADGRMKDSDLRARVVDVCEELFKFTLLTRGHADMLVDRYSEREEIKAKSRLLTQAEKEAEKDALKKAATDGAAPTTAAAASAGCCAPGAADGGKKACC